MRRVELASEAAIDIQDLTWRSLERFGERQTTEYVDGLKRAIALLASLPEMAPITLDLSGARRHVHRSHAIYYDADPGQLTVLRILHVRQDPKRHL